MDAFYEEDERIAGHAADSYHRIDIRQTSRQRHTTHKEVDDEGNRCDGPGCANGRDEAGGAARATGSDQRRRRSGSCVGIRLG
jgi:hypothetical protein